MLVLMLLFEIGLSRLVALSAAVLYAVHPIHTQAVAWIASTGDLACGLFSFASLWMFLRYAKGRSAVWMILSMTSFLLALFSKEMALTLPGSAIVLLLMKWDELKLSTRKAAMLISPLLVVLAGYLALRIHALGPSLPPSFEEHATVVDWITLELWTVGRYLRYIVVPFPQAAFHNSPLYLVDRVVSTILYSLMIVSVIGGAWLLKKTTPTALWWAALFPVLLAPALYLKAISGGFLFAERYLYLPSLAGITLLALALTRLPRRAAIGAVAGLTVVFSVATVLQTRAWKSEEDLFTQSVRWFPENLDGWIQLAQVQLNKGNYTKAQESYEMAERYVDDDRHIKRFDDHYRLLVGIGTLAARRNDSVTAKKYLLAAIDNIPTMGNAYPILAGVLMNLDRNFAGAIPYLEKAMELDPVDDQARDSMGVALYNLHRYEESIPYFQEALRINPQSPLAPQHLEHVLQRLGRR
jgi:tetratricopeptide (TPR) repeat protein